MDAALRLTGIRKTFGATTAVDHLDLAVPAGALYGVIGPNGAGKTTTIRMIMSILFPDSGELSVLGHPLALDAKDRIGYFPEERGVYRKMHVGAFVTYMAQLKGVSDAGLPARVGSGLERVGLGGTERRRCEELSKGMLQKVQVLAAIIHQPDLLILDEPFSGLDPPSHIGAHAVPHRARAAAPRGHLHQHRGGRGRRGRRAHRGTRGMGGTRGGKGRSDRMRRIGLIAAREFLATVATRGFIVGVLIMPAMLALAFSVGPRLMNQRSAPVHGQVAVVDPTGRVTSELRATIDPQAIAARRDEAARRVLAAAPAAVRDRGGKHGQHLERRSRQSGGRGSGSPDRGVL